MLVSLRNIYRSRKQKGIANEFEKVRANAMDGSDSNQRASTTSVDPLLELFLTSEDGLKLLRVGME